MNPIRLVFGVLLLSLCVFGLPEGCLVFASHTATPPPPVYDTDPGSRIAPEWNRKPSGRGSGGRVSAVSPFFSAGPREIPARA